MESQKGAGKTFLMIVGWLVGLFLLKVGLSVITQLGLHAQGLP